MVKWHRVFVYIYPQHIPCGLPLSSACGGLYWCGCQLVFWVWLSFWVPWILWVWWMWYVLCVNVVLVNVITAVGFLEPASQIGANCVSIQDFSFQLRSDLTPSFLSNIFIFVTCVNSNIWQWFDFFSFLALPMHYGLRPIEGLHFRFANLASHFIRVQIFQIDFPLILYL